MTGIETPQFRCRAGFARADITPPVGIYHRMWGAALHDRATGVHRPLTATALALESEKGDRQLILGLDHCILDREEGDRIREAVCRLVALLPTQVHIALSHTHGSAWMSRTRSHLPGGDLIGPYLDRLAGTCADIAIQASRSVQPASLVFGTARCSLAAHRDFRDGEHIVCGYNPEGPADDTVLVGKAVATDGRVLGTVVNYACHPTTLAWQNTLISPDYVGAMREVIEARFPGPCLFLQGASGDLGPREGFVGETEIADRNGRQLGYAALSALDALPNPGTRFEYAGPIVSGATLGTWAHRPLDGSITERHSRWKSHQFSVPLAYRADLPEMAETQERLKMWQLAEEEARTAGDQEQVREARAHAERMTRQIARLTALPPGKSYPFPVSLCLLGDTLWVMLPGELYQVFQTTLRTRFPRLAIVVSTITDDWQPGYLPTAASYGYGIYQETIAAVSAGSLEVLIEAVTREVNRLLA